VENVEKYLYPASLLGWIMWKNTNLTKAGICVIMENVKVRKK